MLLVDVSRFGGGEIRKAVGFRVECRRQQPQRLIKILHDKSIEPLPGHALDDVAQQHEAEVAVMSRFADSPFQRHVANHGVGLCGVRRVVVERLPLHESRRVREQMPNDDAVEVRAAEIG